MWRTVTVIAMFLLGTFCTAAPAAAAAPYFNLHDLGHGVWAAIAVPDSGAGSNAGFVVGPDAVLVVDTFQDPVAATALLEAIGGITKQPVRYVVNTHYHLDHVAGNDVFAEAGAVILAQRNVRDWERTENLKFFGDAPTAEQRQRVATLALPSVTYRDGITIYLGDRPVVVRVRPGHTGGDSIVVIPDAAVVFTGDFFWNHSLPNLVDANTRDQVATNDLFLKDYPEATFVPGHGDVGKASDVRAFRDYLVTLRKLVGQATADGKSGDALVESVTPELEQRFGQWHWFDYFALRNVRDTAAELDGSKHVPVAAQP